MGIKSITSFALAAAALACISISPADARDNDKYLNDLAMRMYLQNQAQSYNPYLYGNYSNYGGYGYVAPNGQTPWSAGAMPYVYGNGNYNRAYGYNYNNRFHHHRHWWR
ncbi:MAG: hypothetical protein JST01_04835 [Cyanobacteria bacterium SZAS TMP-1]|nr:hypothetical protein [Cyanobacteria bacterium SZAS TMP-1]